MKDLLTRIARAWLFIVPMTILTFIFCGIMLLPVYIGEKYIGGMTGILSISIPVWFLVISALIGLAEYQ